MKKILWVTNQPVGPIRDILEFNGPSGTWLDASFSEFNNSSDYIIGVSFPWSCDNIEIKNVNSTNFYLIPRTKKKIYDYSSKKNIKVWEYIINDFRPDIIMIWGTEYSYGLCAQIAAKQIPSVILIQGLLSSVFRHYYGGIEYTDLKKAYSFRNFIKHDSILQRRKDIYKKMQYERMMIEKSSRIICDSEWMKANICGNFPNTKFYKFKLPIKNVFWEKEWNIGNCCFPTIFCTAPGNYPLKGFHILVKALFIVKKQCKNIVLKVPGMCDLFDNNSLKTIIKEDGYIKYIKKLITKYNLKANIKFLGNLNSAEIRNNILQSNVFVVPSSVENHSISLREAMACGAPVIASYVGAMPEIINNGNNGFLYRFEEYEHLAYIILKLLNNKKLASDIGRQAHLDMLNFYSTDKLLECVYNDIFREMEK